MSSERQSRELFKELLKAYYENVLDEKIEDMLLDEGLDKISFSKMISALCGVEVDYSENFSKDVKKAIENYKKSNQVVISTHSCVKNCIQIDGKTICQNACPFDAIIIEDEESTKKINVDQCVGCGICIESCENQNFIDKIEFLPLVETLKSNKKVIAAVAPAIVGQFGEDISLGQLRAAFKQMGFADMVEVAFFADMLTIKEAVEFNALVLQEKDFMLSSCCCPIWVGMIKGRFDTLVKHTSPSISPMIAAGKVMKKLDSECKVVFIGPCVAKKAESKIEDLKDAIDYVLTFTELKDIFDVLQINLEELPEILSPQYTSKGGRIYGKTGGVSLAVEDAVRTMFPDKSKVFKSTQADGVKECKIMLENALNGKIQGNFLEGMGCEGGCVGGPKKIISKESGKEMVRKFGEESKIKISTKNKIMSEFLQRLNIKDLEDFHDKEKIALFERKF
ncbi:MAG: iron hydrogenase [Epulopiscium sp.]|nr:iron hydrogenase [Candidatus Epulonipiscium sp.]